MIKENWIDKISKTLEGVKLTQESIDNMKMLEWFVEDGKGRILACIIKSHKTGIRYSQLLKLTQLPNTNLSKILNELKENEIIYQESIKVEEPRKETVPVYFYNQKKFGNLISTMFDSLIAISRDQINPIKNKISGL